MGIDQIGIALDGNCFGLEIIQIGIDQMGNDSDGKWRGLELIVYPKNSILITSLLVYVDRKSKNFFLGYKKIYSEIGRHTLNIKKRI